MLWGVALWVGVALILTGVVATAIIYACFWITPPHYFEGEAAVPRPPTVPPQRDQPFTLTTAVYAQAARVRAGEGER